MTFDYRYVLQNGSIEESKMPHAPVYWIFMWPITLWETPKWCTANVFFITTFENSEFNIFICKPYKS